MAFKAYIYNMDTGDYHIGCVIDRSRVYEKTSGKYEHARIISSLKLLLWDDSLITWEQIDKLIEEAYSKIGSIPRDTLFTETTSDGELEMFTDGFFAIDATSAKKEIHDAINTLITRGRNIRIA